MYRRGDLSTNGSAHFRELVKPFGNVVVHEGWVPDVFEEMSQVTFGFAHIDLDQYLPTMYAIDFVWERMQPGGIMVCHDWFPEREILAAQAIRDWMDAFDIAPSGENNETKHIWFVRPA
jgi:hypothetical protein